MHQFGAHRIKLHVCQTIRYVIVVAAAMIVKALLPEATLATEQGIDGSGGEFPKTPHDLGQWFLSGQKELPMEMVWHDDERQNADLLGSTQVIEAAEDQIGNAGPRQQRRAVLNAFRDSKTGLLFRPAADTEVARMRGIGWRVCHRTIGNGVASYSL